MQLWLTVYERNLASRGEIAKTHRPSSQRGVLRSAKGPSTTSSDLGEAIVLAVFPLLDKGLGLGGRTALIKYLARRGIQARPLWARAHKREFCAGLRDLVLLSANGFLGLVSACRAL